MPRGTRYAHVEAGASHFSLKRSNELLPLGGVHRDQAVANYFFLVAGVNRRPAYCGCLNSPTYLFSVNVSSHFCPPPLVCSVLNPFNSS